MRRIMYDAGTEIGGGDSMKLLEERISGPLQNAVDTPAAEPQADPPQPDTTVQAQETTAPKLENFQTMFADMPQLPTAPTPALAVEEKPAPAQPVFTPAATDITNQPAASIEKKVAGVAPKAMMKSRSLLQGLLLGMYSGSNDYQKYQFTPEQEEILIQAWEPYRDKVTGLLPEWVAPAATLVTTEASIMLPIFGSAHTERKENQHRKAIEQRNARIQQQSQINGDKSPAPTVVHGKQRTFAQHTLNKAGYYQKDTNNAHVKADDEKVYPDMANREEMRRVIARNGWETTRKALQLTDAYLEQMSIDLEDLPDE